MCVCPLWRLFLHPNIYLWHVSPSFTNPCALWMLVWGFLAQDWFVLGSCAAVHCCWLETIWSKAETLWFDHLSGFMCIKEVLKFSVGKSLSSWQVTEISLVCVWGFWGSGWVVFLLFPLGEFFWFFIPCFSSSCTGYYNGSFCFFLNLLLNLARRMRSVWCYGRRKLGLESQMLL